MIPAGVRVAVERLVEDYVKILRWMDAMYVDKLDGRIEADYFDRKASGWHAELRAEFRQPFEMVWSSVDGLRRPHSGGKASHRRVSRMAGLG